MTTSKQSPVPGRHRISQEDVDAMTALRRQGLGYAEIGARQGVSERTARRYLRGVERRLRLPEPGDPGPDAEPGALRERFARELLDILYKDPQLNAQFAIRHDTGPDSWHFTYDGPPSIIFLNAADRVIREGLDKLGPAALDILARDEALRRRFLATVAGPLISDYLQYHDVTYRMDPAPDNWQPGRERQWREVEDDL